MPRITTLIIPHAIDDGKLSEVKAEMVERGAPTIRVVDCGDYYMAIEGCHRLTAALELGIAPDLDVLDQGDMVTSDSLDFDVIFDECETYTAGEIAGEIQGMHNVAYRLDPDTGLLAR